ncbi:MAG: DUF2029 domain-containing protein [Bacteroidetes bacterium]|nr:DUF2029 domain-containing protein [Bacteroidota bacterium]
MTKKKYIITNIILVIIGLIFLFELIRDSMRNGDFLGYVNAGNLVLTGKNIYSDILNTWPPFFTVFSVILAFGDEVSSILIRLLWLTGSIISMYFIIKLTIKISLNKTLCFRKKNRNIIFQDPIIIIPLLIILRFILENLANVQINIYILLLACLSIFYFIKNKNVLVGLFLALSISLKVYTIFIMLYFLYKRESKPVIWTFIFLFLINSISIFVFGFDKAITYYIYWYSEIASQLPIIHHKNQSIFGFMLRLLTGENSGQDFYINIFALKSESVKYITYGFIFIIFLFPAFLFRKKLIEKNNSKAILEYSFVFSVIPLLSPLAWKAYFIFLWFPYLLTYIFLFRVQNNLNKTYILLLKSLFLLSILFNVFSTDAVVGAYFSDILESVSCITIGTILLIIIQLIIYRKIEKFDLNTIKYQTLPDIN